MPETFKTDTHINQLSHTNYALLPTTVFCDKFCQILQQIFHINFLWPINPTKYAVFVPLSPTSTTLRNILRKHRNSTYCRKQWSLPAHYYFQFLFSQPSSPVILQVPKSKLLGTVELGLFKGQIPFRSSNQQHTHQNLEFLEGMHRCLLLPVIHR